MAARASIVAVEMNADGSAEVWVTLPGASRVRVHVQAGRLSTVSLLDVVAMARGILGTPADP